MNEIINGFFKTKIFDIIGNVINEGLSLFTESMMSEIMLKGDENYDMMSKFVSSINAMNRYRISSLGGKTYGYDNIERMAVPGQKLLFYCGKILKVVFIEEGNNDSVHRSVKISTFSKNTSILEKFYQDSLAYNVHNSNKYAVIFQEYGGIGGTIYKIRRNKSTVFLPDGIIDDVMKDIKYFLENKKEYIRQGRPYKKAMVFAGIPGSGKSSLVSLIASEFNLDVLSINSLSNLNECLVNNEKNKMCLVVIEDLSKEHFNILNGTNTKINKAAISSLINVIDGSCCIEDKIYIITTNNIEELPSVLLRPGRIDKIVNFTHIMPKEITAMVENFYPDVSSNEIEIIINSLKDKKISSSGLQQFLIKFNDIDGIIRNIKDINEYINDDIVNFVVDEHY